MKNSKKCKKNGCKNNNANSMNEAQLESVQGGTGIPEGRKPRDGARMGAPNGWKPGDGAKRK